MDPTQAEKQEGSRLETATEPDESTIRATEAADEADEADETDDDDVDIVLIAFDDTDAEIIAFDGLIERAVVVLDEDEENELSLVRELRDEAQERRIELASASDEKRTEVHSKLRNATRRLREAWSRTRAKIERARQSRTGKGASDGSGAHP